MWRYEQKTGALFDKLGKVCAHGYSGNESGQNNPDAQTVRGVGPLPVGTYKIGPPHESTHVGHYVMDLVPCEGTETFGRSEFRIHGDSVEHPGMASHGCIILPRNVRQQIWESGDHLIEVVTGISPPTTEVA